MNLDKSVVIFSPNVDDELRDVLGGILGVRRSSLMGNSLGLPSTIGRNIKELLGFIKSRIINK